MERVSRARKRQSRRHFLQCPAEGAPPTARLPKLSLSLGGHLGAPGGWRLGVAQGSSSLCAPSSEAHIEMCPAADPEMGVIHQRGQLKIIACILQVRKLRLGERDLSSVSQLMLAVLETEISQAPTPHTPQEAALGFGGCLLRFCSKPFGNTGPVPRGCFPGR